MSAALLKIAACNINMFYVPHIRSDIIHTDRSLSPELPSTETKKKKSLKKKKKSFKKTFEKL